MRAYNFSPGPASIPEAVLKRVQEELLDWRGRGTSIMEISHRSRDFMEEVLASAITNFKTLLHISDDYHVLFITAGTSHQFSMVPLNLLNLKPHDHADYFHTGLWSGKAIIEAKRYGSINVAVTTEPTQFQYIPTFEQWKLNPEAAYVHYTPNETVHGFQFHDIPDTGKVPLVADMSSELLSRQFDVSRFGLIYAGAQKNIGPSGLTIAIIHKDLAGHAKSFTPYLYNYQTYIDSNSLCHTPNTFAIYIANYVFEWLLELGGLSVMEAINQRKAQKIYHLIDQTSFYVNPVQREYRSNMNVIFNLPTPELENTFINEASQHQLLNLKGHIVLGGIRASIYNAMPEKGVDALVEFMKSFEQKYG